MLYGGSGGAQLSIIKRAYLLGGAKDQLLHDNRDRVDVCSHLVNLKGAAWPVFWRVVDIYIASMAVYLAVARVRYMRSVS
jgi:hypothetical protein